jgi:hypothetical protein
MKILDNPLILPLEIHRDETELKLRSLTIKRWLRTDEVALYLGTTVGAIKQMVHRRQLAPKKYCGRNYFSRDEIDGLIDSSNSKRRR